MNTLDQRIPLVMSSVKEANWDSRLSIWWQDNNQWFVLIGGILLCFAAAVSLVLTLEGASF